MSVNLVLSKPNLLPGQLEHTLKFKLNSVQQGKLTTKKGTISNGNLQVKFSTTTNLYNLETKYPDHIDVIEAPSLFPHLNINNTKQL